MCYAECMTTTQRDIARVVKTLLAHQNKTQSELAAHLHVGHSAISKTLNNPHRAWTVDELMKLAEFFDVSPMLFLDGPERLIPTVGTTRNQDDPSGAPISNGTTQRECGDNSLDDSLLQLVA